MHLFAPPNFAGRVRHHHNLGKLSVLFVSLIYLHPYIDLLLQGIRLTLQFQILRFVPLPHLIYLPLLGEGQLVPWGGG
jgi:hypothetical protein